ncbi:kinase-like domain-containing protein [Fusarium oxysporum]|nr:kinase-like domain-containing protein [Fusarium oxysporum]
MPLMSVLKSFDTSYFNLTIWTHFLSANALLYAQGGDIHQSWDRTFNKELVRHLEIFVAEQIGGRGPAKFMENDTSEGTYNRVLRFNLEPSSSDVALKFPKPGHTAANLADEKIANEANWMQYLKERTNIPIPCVYSHGAKGDGNPLELPYILMDWVSGDSLRDFLKETPALRSNVYEQIASYYVQLYRLPLGRIGSVAKDDQTGKWAITKRSLTMDMHQFALGIHKFPTDAWPTGPLESTSAYFDFVVSQQEVQLWHLRNINGLPVCQQEDSQPVPDTDTKSSDMARRRYISRHGFKQLIDEFCISYDDPQPFRVFNPDLDPRNFLVDPETGNITGLIDLGFTNAMPFQFALNPPLWLSPVLPEQCLDRGFFPWFLREYRPLLEEFLAAMKRVQGRLEYKSKERPLSAHMLESWHTDRVWFNFAATHTDHVDSIYWEKLCKYHPAGAEPELPEQEENNMEKYVQHTKGQLAEYEDAWNLYYKKTSHVPE